MGQGKPVMFSGTESLLLAHELDEIQLGRLDRTSNLVD
jgi:hypothetical protein